MFDRFLIAPINTGLQTDIKSWLIMDDAFEYLQNAYVFRGRVRKRFGSVLMGATPLQSRLRINIGTVAAHTIPGGITQLQIGQMFSVGADIFQIYQLGAGVLTLSTNTGATATIDTTVNPNTVVFTGEAAGSVVFYYPSKPVMGISQYEIGAVNNHPTYAFDPQFAYVFVSGTGWVRSGTALWHGNDLNFFWVANWQALAGTQYLFVSNFNATTGAGAPAATDDPIWSFDGTTWVPRLGSTANGFFFLPNPGIARTAAPFVQTARIIVPFKNRLVLLNTVENNNSGANGTGTATAYVNRCRYSFNGSPLALNAWYEPNTSDSGGVIAAGAGFIDASTEEQIISAEFIKDRLIVYFERSTWELAYTGNEILPFIWNKLNTELGSMSTFSTIPFDKEILTIGQSGVHASNGSNVIRIDDKIPDEIFEFDTSNSRTQRTVGIRDYFTETSIWTFVSDLEEPTQTYPNQILVYNYKNGSWALNDDCFTFFGYFEQQTDTTWATSAPLLWFQANMPWNSGVLQSNQRQIIGGTPEGFVLRLNSDVARNAPSMSITNMTFAATGIVTLTIVNHNLSTTPFQYPYDNDFILIENVVADIFTESALNGFIYPINSVIDANTITIDTTEQVTITTGTYYGSGTAARVSNIQITTKRFNPYVNNDRNVYVAKIDFAVGRTVAGEITVDYYPSSTNVSMVQGGTNSGSIIGNSILEMFPYDPNLYPLETFQELLWHPVYFQTSGQYVQFAMYLTVDQMIDPTIALSEFELEAMLLYTNPTASRLE